MKNFNIVIASVTVLLVTGCVKPTQEAQTIYTDPATQPVYPADSTQPIVYDPSGTTAPAGTVYEEYNPNAGTTIVQPITYPDPYATGGSTTTSYPDPYASQPAISDYPATTYPSTPTAPVAQGGGIHLQIAALKDYYTAEDYKNRLSLEPGLSAYVVRGNMNKVIVAGIPSVAEANRLKESRFPGAFIYKGASTGGSTGYSVPADPYGSTGGGAYTIDNPYASQPSMGGNSGIGVQIGAFGSQGKAQSIANSQGGQYPAVVKKIGRYWKVILTGFSSRSAAKAHANRVGGFVVDVY
jgi:hypothetical protein